MRKRARDEAKALKAVEQLSAKAELAALESQRAADPATGHLARRRAASTADAVAFAVTAERIRAKAKKGDNQ